MFYTCPSVDRAADVGQKSVRKLALKKPNGSFLEMHLKKWAATANWKISEHLMLLNHVGIIFNMWSPKHFSTIWHKNSEKKWNFLRIFSFFSFIFTYKCEDLSLEGFIYLISTSLHILSTRHHIDRCSKLHGNHIRLCRPPYKNDYKSAEKTVIQTFTLDHVSLCCRISKHTFLYFNSASQSQYSNISWTASLSSVRRSLRSSPCDPASL